MRLFKTLSALAVVRAQVPDFTDLNALFASLTENLNVVDAAAPADEVDAARYVVATTTTTPPHTTTYTSTSTVTQGEGCWKCDAMSFTTCATEGYWQQCSPDQTAGDYGVCFLELRETNQLLTQLCTGCKSRNACYNLRRQNFVGSTGSNLSRFHDQCKPEWKLQRVNRRYGNQQSVCRTCFQMCPNNTDDSTGIKCFGGMEIGTTNDVTDQQSGDFFMYDTSMTTGSDQQYWTSQATASVHQTHVLGLPLGVTCPATNTQCTDEVDNMTNMVNWGGDYTTTGNTGNASGKRNTGRGKSDTEMGLYWAIQDQTKTWWEYDHIVLQTLLQATGAGNSFVARLNAGSEFTGLQDLV